MFLIYWTVTIVFSISVVSESQVGTSGLTLRTIVPLPTPDCWSPSCLTWSQCLADSSQCFTSHTTVAMQPGEYILHEFVGVTGVESLSIYGSRSEMNVSARENQVVINCKYREGGLGFTRVANFSLSGITVTNCGVQGVNIGFSNRTLRFVYFALHILEGFNVNLSFLFIRNSTQIGLLCTDLWGTSGIHDSVITHSNYRLLEKYMQGEVECFTDKWDCQGGNMWILFYDPLIKVASNIANFTVERTKISYGVGLQQNINRPLSSGVFIKVRLKLWFGYDVQISITECNFTNNIATVAAHLHMKLFSNCSVLVKDSSFTFANRITEDDLMKLIPVVHPEIGTLVLYSEAFHNVAIDVQIVINEVHIAENVGGGLTAAFHPEFSQTYIQLRLKNVVVVHNFLPQDDFQVYCYVLRLEGNLANSDQVYIALESVELSNNVLVPHDQDENIWTYFEQFLCALSLRNTEVHLKQSTFFNNSISAVYSYNSIVHFHGVNVFRNNTGGQCGGALVLRINSQMYLHRGTQVYILENTALKYGGGICVDGGSVPETYDVCFWQIVDPDILNNNDTFVYLEGNVASIAGYEIYAGTVERCFTLIDYKEQTYPDKVSSISRTIYAHVFHFGFLNTSFSSNYQVSSLSLTICYCYQWPELMCSAIVMPNISVYPGQTFRVMAVGVGVGISPAVVRSRISSKYTISPEHQDLGNACEPLNYTILAPENISGILAQLTVEGSYPKFDRYLNLTTLKCPQGFALQQLKCGCHPMLQRASVECNINTQRFTRSGSVWIGLGSDEEGLLTHMHCPNAYCKLQETDLNFTSPDVQCASGHSGVLCGECESGLALMLGSSKRQYCSNIYLLLILPFLAAGVLLVIILGRLNLTVASGTMNGVLFYANVVKASSDALISNSVSKYFMILSAWLNLDLGIETCFSSHLDMFWKVLLQFAFPLYIWLLVVGIILLSRYSTVAARLSGSNSVPVLATLFLLSYAKVLAAVIVAFSFTYLQAEGISPLVWLHDGNLRFLQGQHIALVLVSSLFAVFYIIPLTLLLLFAPVLRRAHNRRIVRLVQRLKPLLDAFQGPYKDRFHWWPGLMLVIRIILLPTQSMTQDSVLC